jgi:hypothetical protein
MFGPPLPANQQPSFAALPPSTTSTAPSAEVNGYGNAAADPWGHSSYGAPPPAPAQPSANPYGATAPLTTLPYGAHPNSTAPAVQDPFGGGAYGAPPPEPLATPQGAYGGQNSFASPLPTSIAAPQQDYTPATQASSIGFASPVAQPYGAQWQQMNEFDQQPPQQEQYGMHGDQFGMNGFGGPHTGSSDAAQADFTEESSANPYASEASAPSDPALLSMNVLSGSSQPLVSENMKDSNGSIAGSSMADQAYAKLVNMDAFDLVQDKGAQSRNNPFDVASTTSNNTSSLADMMKTKSNKSGEKKEVMKSYAPAPGAMVLSSSQQQGNFGGYGSQYGLGGIGVAQQQPPAMSGVSMPAPPPAPMQGYGGMQSQPYGQPHGQAPGYGMQAAQMQQPYGMQQQQPLYGQQPPMQQQQSYGNPPPMQQQPFGF